MLVQLASAAAARFQALDVQVDFNVQNII